MTTTITTIHQLSTVAYNVTFDTGTIYTTVTHDPSIVAQWIQYIISLYGHHGLIVGLDVEWAPNYTRNQPPNPVATLQLCVGRCCLIYQLIRSPYLPTQLNQFLSFSNNIFFGVEVASDLDKLYRDYRIGYNVTAVDVRSLACEVYGRTDLKGAGLKGLAKVVLGREVEKPKSVTMSRWDDRWLSVEQVKYACVDAFLGFEIGRVLSIACVFRWGAGV